MTLLTAESSAIFSCKSSSHNCAADARLLFEIESLAMSGFLQGRKNPVKEPEFRGTRSGLAVYIAPILMARWECSG